MIAKRNRWSLLWIGTIVLLWAFPAAALPSYAVRSVSECNTCHIEPSGWKNPDLSERRCTLECQSCHLSPAGGGLRVPDGRFFGTEVLPIFGERPSASADPEKYRPEGHPEKGQYSLWEGFSGWWPGEIPHREIADRYGSIEPDPEWMFGGDFRAAVLHQRAAENNTYVFPMQADFYVANESVDDLRTYLNLGLQGAKDTDRYSDMEALDYLVIRELFAQLRLPYNSSVRAGRLIPRYGWRTPDHTAFVREDLGMNQNFHALGVEGLYNPNYLYADLSLYRQGVEFWPGDQQTPGWGSTFNLGFRDLGYHVGLSGNVVGREDGLIWASGLQWALNLAPLTYLGQLDFRQARYDGKEAQNGLVAHHEWTAPVVTGVLGRLQYDWSDLDIDVRDDHRHRITLAVDVHPYTYVHLQLAGRLNWKGVNPIASFGDRQSTEVLLMSHLWF